MFHYDPDNRLTAATWLSSAGATVNLLTYTYDYDGNQLTAADYSGTYTNSYDAQDRLTAQTDPLGLTLTYTYDAAGDVTPAGGFPGRRADLRLRQCGSSDERAVRRDGA